MQTQYIVKNEDGCFYYSDKEMNIRHRTDGPAIECADGTKSWYLNGKRHRTDGPAVEWSDGSKTWYLNGRLHRTDGPAFEYSDGSKYWYLNNEQMTEHEYQKRTKQISTIEINGKHFTIEELNKLISGAKR